jgi:xanthine dehydrogenase small subunit
LPKARLLAGGTDIGLWVNKQFRDLGDVLYLGHVQALRCIETRTIDGGPVLRIGAAVSLEDGWARLCSHWPSLSEMFRRFASPPVRHAGTLVGNIANGSPIGDSAPVLMALDASLELRQGDAMRVVPLDAFYAGYMRNALQPGEFVQAVRIPLPAQASGASGQSEVRAYKISKRFDCDISAVSMGARLQIEAGRIVDLRLALGGMAATVQRAPATESALRGQPWDESVLKQAQAALEQDFQPLTDVRGSASYRLPVSYTHLRAHETLS